MSYLSRIALAAALLLAIPAHAETPENAPQSTTENSNIAKQVIQNTTFGGYIVSKAGLNNQEDAVHSNLEIRLARAYVKGTVMDFAYTLQMEISGVGGSAGEKGPRIIDAYAEWQKYKFLRIKFGQFKRAFSFENPMNPWDISAGGYSQITNKIASISDRCGEHASGGRDLGIQLQGDLFPSSRDGHAFLHYQVGLWQGSGINHSDNNNHKDLIGGLYVSPIKGLNIGWWGWNGKYKSNGITVDRKRWTAGIKYDGLFTARAEYAHSYGYKISDWDANTNSWKNSNKSDGWYALVGAPVTRDKKLRVYAKVDSYNDYLHLDYSTNNTIYGITAEYWFTKNLKLQLNGSTVNNKSLTNRGADGKYCTTDIQLYWRF